ncbi:hypothetical protein G4B88_004940 [Cannabis sativa]|uniref:Uncharacterized protein n=1 Tax=Cannabis sativa TaxID=3483 RepID=A0A7J6FZH8_CANSA|nr:hypothetical protein G4B88_004940 [Cannabis sativa]
MVFSSVCSFPSSLGTNFKLVPRSNFKASSSHYHEINNFINNKPIKFSYFSSRLYCSAKPIVHRENKFTKSFSLSHLQRKSSIKAHGEIEADGSNGTSEFNVMKSGNAIWRFVRPYAAKGVLFNSATSGINQIYDLDIDRLNKPNLPVASGEISVELAWLLTILYVGTSVGVYYACKASLGLPANWRFGIITFSTKFGAKPIAYICHGLMLLNYCPHDSSSEGCWSRVITTLALKVVDHASSMSSQI